MTERLDEAKKYIESYKEDPNRYRDLNRYWGKAADILMVVNKTAISEEEAREAGSLTDELLSIYFSVHPYVDHEKLISFLSGKLSEETCIDLTKLLLEEPYWLHFQHLGYGMTIRNILREVCDDFDTLESSWDNILIKAVKRKIGLKEKLPLKCWPCKWNDRCEDKVCQPIYNEDRSNIVWNYICKHESDLCYEGSNGLTYEER